MENIQALGPCRNWHGAISDTGYGTTTVRNKTVLAHRHVYQQERGPIPSGLVLDHLCRNRRCVNPDHLEPVTIRENVLRSTAPSAIHAAKTHCIHGHEFTPENTYTPPSRRCRMCRACMRERDKRRPCGWERCKSKAGHAA